jgi:Sec-independent protein translocase protein TatA
VTVVNLFHLGQSELIVIFAIVILLFEVERIGKIGGELGSGIRAFKSEFGGNA